ncbi:MAG TPA: hypothetical protein VGQ90_16430, partial [Stellaceae bacterium]|nr:hypothetical protein [Stellaceae bacterium]
MILSRFIYPAFAAIFVIGPVASGLAQTGGASGARGSNSGPAAASTVGTGAQSVTPDNASDVVGSGGSAAAGDTSASSLGLGAYSTAPTGTSSTLGTGGSAATPSGHATSRSGVHGNRNLSGQSMNQAHDPGGVWSKSHT